jgi:hypothetical protein
MRYGDADKGSHPDHHPHRCGELTVDGIDAQEKNQIQASNWKSRSSISINPHKLLPLTVTEWQENPYSAAEHA